MKKQILAAAALTGTFALPASADILGAKAGMDFWYADAKINSISADDANFQQSYHASLEHFIPIVPNAKIRYTGVKSTINNAASLVKGDVKFDQYDLIAYYEILDNDLLILDIGLNLQHFNGTFLGKKFSEWQPNLYADGAIGLPGFPVSVFATFSAGEFDKTSTVDAEAGALYSLDLAVAAVNFKVGYRIIDHDFAYFPTAQAKIQNTGFFFGVDVDI